MPVSWNIPLVVLSLLVAMTGSFAALTHAQRMREGTGRCSRVWLLTGGVTLGVAIWATHFIGMLAFHLPVALSYDLHLTLLSVFPAIASALIGFYLLCTPEARLGRLAVGSVVMGLGISAMHYTGMAALRMSVPIHYSWLIVAVSVLLAISAALGALLVVYVGQKNDTLLRYGAGSTIMGLAIAGMHYTGMAAAEFAAGSFCLSGAPRIEPDILAVLVSMGALFLFGGGLLAALYDLRVARQKAVALEQLQAAHAELEQRAKKTAEEMTRELSASRSMLSCILDTVPQSVFWKDRNSVYLGCNRMFAKNAGLSDPAEIAGKTDFDLPWTREESEAYRADDRWVMSRNVAKRHIVERQHNADGSDTWLETSKVPLADGGMFGVLGVYDDISERVRTQAALQESETRNRLILDESMDAVISADQDGRVVGWNKEATRMFGYSAEQALGRMLTELIVPPAHRESHTQGLQRFVNTGEASIVGKRIEITAIRADGAEFPIELAIAASLLQGRYLFSAFVRDITERRTSEARIRRLSELYAALSQCNQAIVRCSSEAELFPQICLDAVQQGGMKMAWIGMLDESSRMLMPAASFGVCTEYLDGIRISVDAAEPAGNSPIGVAMREDRPYWCQDYKNEPSLALWRERGERAGWGAAGVLPLHRSGRVVGAIVLYSGEINAFDESTRNLLTEMAMDIDYALDSYALQAERKQMARQLASSEQHLRTIIEAEPECVKLLAQDGTVLQMNPAGLRMLEVDDLEQIIGKKVPGFIVPQYREAFSVLMRRVFEGETDNLEFEVIGLKGGHRWLDTHAVPMRDTEGKITAMLGVTRDITARRRDEEAMRVAAVTFETQEAIVITDPGANILRVNQAFQSITGYSAEEVVGRNPRILQSGLHDAAFYQAMWAALLGPGKWSGEVMDRRKNGEIYPKAMTITAVYDDRHQVTHYVAVFRDISNRKKSEQEIHQLAFYDPLTRLPNRRLLQDRLQQAMAASLRNGHHGALLFLDLDHFKTINDTQGHAVGDLLLVEVACRLQDCVREGDSVARLGGDEFVVLLEALSSSSDEAASQAELVAEKIRNELGKPYTLKDFECLSTPSIGISLFLGQMESMEDLLQHADVAMYQAKTAGRNAIRFFDPAMQLALDMRTEMEADMRLALDGGQFALHYQVQIDSRDMAIGAEVLLRWQHPERGCVFPDQFVPLAEETGLIVPIGLWVLQTACAQLRLWQQNALTRDLTLAVNVSARQFRQSDFVEQVQRALLESGAKPSQLKLELTESTVLENVDDTIAKMREIKMLGVDFAMDDFGTGYSSLQYLKRLPLDQIKIDKSFVVDIISDPNDAVIVQTIIAMTQAMGLNVIAEGVETVAQREFLDKHGCHAFQGYLFSQPVPIAEFEMLLEKLA